MTKKDFLSLLAMFFSWRILTLIFLLMGVYYLHHSSIFLGGGLSNYLSNPYFWSWGNFDGEHYLSIARWGYKPLQYFFFPIFPLIVSLVSRLTGTSLINYLFSGLFINHLLIFIALIGFWKLLSLDYKKPLIQLIIILVLIFPTSFFFLSFYTETIFFTLVIWSFYFARKGNCFLSSLLAGISSATRIVGILLLPCLLIEYFIQKKNKLNLLNILIIILFSLSGILVYMYFLKIKTGDPLNFFNNVGIFGNQRSAGLILLPQVFYRYIFKIFPNLSSNFISSFPIIFEFVVGFIYLVFSIIGLFKLRLSYAFFLIGGYLIPTFSGSFSSLPRYVLVLFPAYILMAIWLEKTNKFIRIVIYVLLLVLLGISTILFTRGYWIA